MNVNRPGASNHLPLEIERKFLIRYPDLNWLQHCPEARCTEIVQTYLLSRPGESRRVRSWTENGSTVYIRTFKQSLTDRTRIEREEQISPEEYDILLQKADPERRPIEKKRWCIPYGSHTLEIDLYPFWSDQAVLEVELKSEDEEFLLPPELEVIREVTGDPRYLNSSLAREIP